MCRAYDLKWKGGILDCISQPVNKPDGPVSLNFTPR
uniref:Uncharacterized protein n=1 Tax=Bracon brevicornis TaxID=1563983 RepID=A0A6V7LE99_9HYME